VHLAPAQHAEGVRGPVSPQAGKRPSTAPGTTLTSGACRHELALAAGEGLSLTQNVISTVGSEILARAAALDRTVADRIAYRYALYARQADDVAHLARSTGVRFSPSNWYMFVIFAL